MEFDGKEYRPFTREISILQRRVMTLRVSNGSRGLRLVYEQSTDWKVSESSHYDLRVRQQ